MPARFAGTSLDRPRIDLGVDVETWNMFERRWEAYRGVAKFSTANASAQLFHCATEALGDVLLKLDAALTTRNLDQVTTAMRTLAIIPVARGVTRAELMRIDQSPDEAFRTFAARVRGTAETCGFRFQSKCKCELDVVSDYTDEMIRDVMMAGIADSDIRREALGAAELQDSSVNNGTAFVERREMARNALPASVLSAVSSYRKTSAKPDQPEGTKSDRSNASKPVLPAASPRKVPCPNCGAAYLPLTGRNFTAHKLCIDCFCLQRRKKPSSNNVVHHMGAIAEEDFFTQISSIQTATTAVPKVAYHRRASIEPVKHQIFNRGEWRRAQFMEHPTVNLQVSFDRHNNVRPAQTGTAKITAITDTGAQYNLWSMHEILAAGFAKESLLPVASGFRAANSSPIKIAGAFVAQLSGRTSAGNMVMCRTMIYVG
jgi:hypothetical protein